MMEPGDAFQEAMLAAGWQAVFNAHGDVILWQDPEQPQNQWRDAEARCYYQAGDEPSAPPTVGGLLYREEAGLFAIENKRL